jgi:energy-coupling factor transporter transmembrane protein EcfT
LRFAELDEWALRDSALHRRDPRSKIVAVVLLLVAIGRGHLLIPALAIGAALVFTRLPIGPVLLRACVVLPFSLSFAVAGALAGEHERAGYALLRSYLSAVSVVVLLGCTPLRLYSAAIAARWLQATWRADAAVGSNSVCLPLSNADRGTGEAHDGRGNR